jgi:hypothetical protein
MLPWETGKTEGETYLRFGLIGFGITSLFAIKRPLERKEIYSTHQWLQYLWHFNTILLLIVLQNTAKGSLSCSQGRIQHVNKLLGLLVILRYTLVVITDQTLIDIRHK